MMGSPRLFDIDYRGGDELEIVLEASIGQYERRLTPDSTFGPYQAVRALLVYKESPCPPPPAWHTAGLAGLPALLGSRHEAAARAGSPYLVWAAATGQTPSRRRPRRGH